MTAESDFISEIVEKVPLPPIYWQLRMLLNNANAKIADYEQLIQVEPSLETQVIRIANSEFFGFDRKAESLYDAISLIGTNQLHDLLLGSFSMQAFTNFPGQVTNHLKAFWRQGIKRGIAARTIAKFCRMPGNNQFFTVGFLLGIGHVAMLIKAPELVFSTMQESQRLQRPIHTLEREFFGFDYCQLGAALLRQWRIPEFYPQVLECHLYPEHAKPSLQNETEVAYLAYCLCDTAHLEEHRKTRILSVHQEMTVKELVAMEISNYVDEIYSMLSNST
jgi:HD-like signal output (HDOD) protein